MSFGKVKKSVWYRQAAIVISGSSNIQMLLRELLRGYQWNVIESTSEPEYAIQAVKTGAACLVIVDDSPDMPASYVIRQLSQDPMMLMTPILSFYGETSQDDIQKLCQTGQVEAVPKPLTPSKFLPVLTRLLKRWESKAYVFLRKKAYESMLKGDVEAAKDALTRLLPYDGMQALVSLPLARYYSELGQMRDAEKILLHSLKRSPRNLPVSFALSDLYLNVATPHYAFRLLNSLKAAYPKSRLVFIELIQTSIMMGRLNDALIYLNHMMRCDYMPALIGPFLARVCLSEGKEKEAEKALLHNKHSQKRLLTAWKEAESFRELTQEEAADGASKKSAS